MTMHKIQQFIISQLGVNDSLRYTDMRPPTMEASQFMHHLKNLIKLGLVTKLENGMYSLTNKGHLLMDRANEELNIRAQARIGALIMCDHPVFGTLMVKRNTQPALGAVGLPIIDIPLGFNFSLDDFVIEEMESESGIISKLKHVADGYINIAKNNDLTGSLLAHVYVGKYGSGSIKQSYKNTYMWESELDNNDKTKIIGSTIKVKNLINKNKNNFFFFEIEIDL
jgi:hypothetical protein